MLSVIFIILWLLLLLPAIYFGGIGILIWIAIGITLFLLIAQRSVMRRRALLDLLAVAAEKRMPLGKMVVAFAADLPARHRRPLFRLADRLEHGDSLSTALKRSKKRSLRRAAGLAAIGERTGTLGRALRQVVAEDERSWPLRHMITGRVLYLCGIVTAIMLTSIFFFTSIVPAYIKIFEDFGVELPCVTIVAIRIASSSLVEFLALSTPVLAVIVAIWIILYYIGLVRLPTFALAPARERTGVLQALALAVESGMPLNEALRGLINYPDVNTAWRLSEVAGQVDAGGDWIESLLDMKLVDTQDAEVMQSAQRVGNLPWALRQVADAQARRSVYRREIFVNILSPLVLLAVASLVMFFVVAGFLPLVTLIEWMS